MAHLDFKITSWKRLHIPDDQIDEVIQQLKEGGCDAPYDLLEIEGVYYDTQGVDEECEEPLLPEENGGASTQEMYTEGGSLIYYNGDNNY